MPKLFFGCTGKYSGKIFLSDSQRLGNFLQKQTFLAKLESQFILN